MPILIALLVAFLMAHFDASWGWWLAFGILMFVPIFPDHA